MVSRTKCRQVLHISVTIRACRYCGMSHQPRQCLAYGRTCNDKLHNFKGAFQRNIRLEKHTMQEKKPIQRYSKMKKSGTTQIMEVSGIWI